MSRQKKILILGDSCTGKTSLLSSYCNSEFTEEHLPTIHDTYNANVRVGSRTMQFSLWDTAGEHYDRLRPLSYPGTDVILLCFSVDNPISLENIYEKWFGEVFKFCPRVPFILVGNKLDLRYNTKVIQELREYNLHAVTYQEGLKTARKLRAAKYIECSAKTLEGVRILFEAAAELSLTRRIVRRRICVML